MARRIGTVQTTHQGGRRCERHWPGAMVGTLGKQWHSMLLSIAFYFACCDTVQLARCARIADRCFSIAVVVVAVVLGCVLVFAQKSKLVHRSNRGLGF